MDRLRREVEELKEVIKWERDETEDLREGLTGKCRRREAKIRDLECTIEEMCNSHQRVVEGQAQYIRTVEQRLKQTEELLAARSAELTGTQTFLSTTDRLSEVEVLSIVRDLNENIYQVAVRLTEEWEKLESPPAANLMDVDPTSQPHVPVLVQLVRNRDSSGLTFLLQSYLCSQVTSMSSGWSHHPELAILGSIYEQLSASGEHRRRRRITRDLRAIEEQSISARWRSLTHSYLFRPPLDSALLIEGLARILKCTGSFSSTERSLEFVQTTALEGIVSIARLVVRSEFAFTVEVTSSDMFLLFEPPDSGFNDGSMVSEFGSDGTGAQDKVAGTTEVGVGKSVRGGLDGSRRMEILLKTKVVLEKDLLEGKE